MTSELVATVVVLATMAGAGLAVLRDWWNSTQPTPSIKVLAKNLIIAAFGSLAIVNLTNIPDPSSAGFLWVELIVGGIISGAGIKAIVGHS